MESEGNSPRAYREMKSAHDARTRDGEEEESGVWFPLASPDPVAAWPVTMVGQYGEPCRPARGAVAAAVCTVGKIITDKQGDILGEGEKQRRPARSRAAAGSN